MVAAPVAVVALLLLLATWFDGGFDVRYWAPIAILSLAFLVGSLLSGGLRIDRGPFALAVAGLWGLDGLDGALRALGRIAGAGLGGSGAHGPLRGVGDAGRHASGPQAGAAVWARASSPGIVVIAVVTLVGLFADGGDLFLAGRLDEPIGYRNAVADPVRLRVLAADRYRRRARPQAAAAGGRDRRRGARSSASPS